MYDFIYKLWFIYNEFYMMGMEEKTRNAIKRKMRKPRKNSPLVALLSPRLRNGGWLFSGVRKTSRTFDFVSLPVHDEGLGK